MPQVIIRSPTGPVLRIVREFKAGLEGSCRAYEKATEIQATLYGTGKSVDIVNNETRKSVWGECARLRCPSSEDSFIDQIPDLKKYGVGRIKPTTQHPFKLIEGGKG